MRYYYIPIRDKHQKVQYIQLWARIWSNRNTCVLLMVVISGDILSYEEYVYTMIEQSQPQVCSRKYFHIVICDGYMQARMWHLIQQGIEGNLDVYHLWNSKQDSGIHGMESCGRVQRNELDRHRATQIHFCKMY